MVKLDRHMREIASKVSHTTIENHIKCLRLVKKLDIWVPIEVDGEGSDENDDDGESPSTLDGGRFSASESDDLNEEENVEPIETKGGVKKKSSPKSSPKVRERKRSKVDQKGKAIKET